MKLSKMILGLILIFGCAGSIPTAIATQDPGTVDAPGMDADRGTDKAAGPRQDNFGVDDWEEGDDDQEKWRKIRVVLKNASGDDLEAAMELLLDPDIPLEDAVMILLVRITERMDKEIEEQAEKIKERQAGTEESAAGTGSISGMDTETMKLKRQTERRGQLFDTMRQIIDQYDESAKSAIQRMRN